MFWYYIDRKWWAFTALGLIYLFIESSFAISLLEAVRNDTVHTLEDMDKVGRILSGLGATLLVCKAIAHSGLNRKFYASLLLGGLTFFGVYKAQEEAVRLLEVHTPTYIKEQVYDGYTFHRAATSGAYDFHRARYNGAGVPEYIETAFWGTYGFHSTFNRGTRNPETARDISLRVFQKDFETHLNFYYSKYIEAEKGINSALDAYYVIQEEVKKEINKQSLVTYKKVSSEYNQLPRYLKTQSKDRVMAEVRQRVFNEAGFWLPRDWDINDQVGFRHYFNKHHMSESLEKETSDIYFEKTGIKVEGDINSKGELFKQRAFQKAIADKVELFYTSSGFLTGLTKEQFKTMYRKDVPVNLSKMYAKGKSSETTLNTVFKLSLMPLLAICFSLIFLVLNFSSLTYSLLFEAIYLGEMRFSSHAIRIGILAAAVFVPIYSTNALNTDPFYLQNLGLLVEATSPEFGWLYEWVVSVSMTVTSLLGDIYIPVFVYL